MPALGSSLNVHVVVVARGPETRDGYADYLRAVGARAQTQSELTVPSDVDLVILFGDDFDLASSQKFVDDWSRLGASRCRMILVTNHEALAARVRSDPLASVLRRPLWGWVLLAAVCSTEVES
jgi:hypothetical protein